MIAEPYICTKGSDTGQIHWYTQVPAYGWIPYADFERGKLKELDNVKTAYCGFQGITISCKDCYWVLLSRKDCADNKCTFPWQTLQGDRAGEKQHCHHYGSADLIGYKPSDYDKDSESSRLLKRAEFLKAVCKKEGVEWVPKEKCRYISLCCDRDPCKCGKEDYGPGGRCKPDTEERQGFWKGNKRREGTEHLTYTTKDGDCIGDPELEMKEEWREQCQLIVDSTYGKNAIDDMLRDYYTKEEEKEFREELLNYLMEESTKGRDGQKFRIEWVESLRKKYL